LKKTVGRSLSSQLRPATKDRAAKAANAENAATTVAARKQQHHQTAFGRNV